MPSWAPEWMQDMSAWTIIAIVILIVVILIILATFFLALIFARGKRPRIDIIVDGVPQPYLPPPPQYLPPPPPPPQKK